MYYDLLCYAVSHYTVLCHIVLQYSTLCYIALCCFISYCLVIHSNSIVPCCYFISFLSSVLSCCTILHYVTLYYINYVCLFCYNYRILYINIQYISYYIVLYKIARPVYTLPQCVHIYIYIYIYRFFAAFFGLNVVTFITRAKAVKQQSLFALFAHVRFVFSIKIVLSLMLHHVLTEGKSTSRTSYYTALSCIIRSTSYCLINLILHCILSRFFLLYGTVS